MATPSINQVEFQAIVNGMVHQKFLQCSSPQIIMNRAVRFVVADVDLRSSKRSAPLSPNMFQGIYDYAAPNDLKGEKVIDIRRQVNRPFFEKWSLVDDSEFDRKKTFYKIALRDENFIKFMKVSGLPNSSKATIHGCDSITSNGTWAASADASNLTVDTGNFITGNGSLNFDMAKGAATGVLELTGATQVNLTDFDEQGSLFAWVFIPDYADEQADTVTNFILRWGNDSSNYWHRTVTVDNAGNTLHDGWNLLRFDWSVATEVGTVVPSAIDYVRLTVTKSTSLEADTDWRLDDVICVLGDVYDTVYYSKYGWQTSALAYIEESTTTTDLLLGDTDEIEMIANKAAEYASQELKEYDEVPYFKGEYENLKRKYESNNPSEALKKTRNYAALPNLNNRY